MGDRTKSPSGFQGPKWLSSGQGVLLLLSHFSRVGLSATPRTAAHQAPLSTGVPRQEYWSGLAFPSPQGFLGPGLS